MTLMCGRIENRELKEGDHDACCPRHVPKLLTPRVKFLRLCLFF